MLKSYHLFARTAVYKLGVLCFVKSLYKENLDSGISICMVRHTNNKSLKHQGETLGGGSLTLLSCLQTHGHLESDHWRNETGYHCEVLWSLHFAKTRQTPTIHNYVTSTATFLMVADAPCTCLECILSPLS